MFEHMQTVTQLITLNSIQISNIQDQKIKNHNCCPFQGLSNGTTLMQIQSGRAVLLKDRKHFILFAGVPTAVADAEGGRGLQGAKAVQYCSNGGIQIYTSVPSISQLPYGTLLTN
jgi:hypothetical protein